MNTFINLAISFIILFLKPEVTNVKDCLYDDYWYYVGKANIAVHEGNYHEAVDSYEKAFETNLFKHSIDLHNAILAFNEIGNYEMSMSLAIELAKGGAESDYFIQYEAYPWYSQFIEDFDAYQNSFDSSFNSEYRRRLLSLGTQDSIINARYHAFRKGELEISLEKLIVDATSIKDSFINLVKEYDFPSEENIGYMTSGFNTQRLPVMIILHHTYQRGDLLFLSDMNKVVCDGKLRPTDHTLLNNIRGFGDSTGIENEMRLRYKRIMNSRG